MTFVQSDHRSCNDYFSSDASFFEKQLDTMQQGAAADDVRKELGYILRDIEDASRMLRLARAERDAALKVLNDLNAKHWALLSEYEAAKSFEMDENIDVERKRISPIIKIHPLSR